MPKRPGRKSAAQTPAPRSERIYGSKKNKPGSASGQTEAKITLSDEVVKALQKKADEFNEKHPSKRVTVGTLKKVFRRGSGAYSKSHRPTISGNRPNSRTAWSYARVNKFLKKKAGQKVKAAYVQDDDLLMEGGEIMANGGLLGNYAFTDKGMGRIATASKKLQNTEENENANQLEVKIFNLIGDWIEGSEKPEANSLYKNRKTLDDLKKQYPSIFQAPKNKLVYRGLEFPSDALIEEFFNDLDFSDIIPVKGYFKDNDFYFIKKPVKYIPRQNAESWTTELKTAMRFGEYGVVLVTKTSDNFYMNPEVLDAFSSEILGAKEHEVILIGKEVENVHLMMSQAALQRFVDKLANLKPRRFKGLEEFFEKGGKVKFNDKELLSKYKRGESIGFTATAHLKAKGLIPRADGTKRKSDKYLEDGGTIKDYLKNVIKKTTSEGEKYYADFGRDGKIVWSDWTSDANTIYIDRIDRHANQEWVGKYRYSETSEGKKDAKGEGSYAIASLFMRYPDIEFITYNDASENQDGTSFWYRIGGDSSYLFKENFFDYFNSKYSQFNDGGVVFVRNKAYDNSQTIRRLPYRGVSAFAIHTDDFEKFKQYAEKQEGVDPSNWQVYNLDDFQDYEVCAMEMDETNDYVMGFTDEKPTLKPFNPDEHSMFIDENGQLDYDDAHEVIILPKKMVDGGMTALFVDSLMTSAKEVDAIIEYALENEINPKNMTLDEFNEKVNPEGKYSKFEVRLAKRDLSIYYKDGGNVKATNMEITCKKCGWEWNTVDSDASDAMVCHKCGTNNVSEDIIQMNSPTYLRSLEFAREDAKEDVDLHKVTENAVALSKDKPIRMSEYEELVKLENGGFAYEPKEYEIQDFVCMEQDLVDSLKGSDMTKIGKIRICQAKIDLAENKLKETESEQEYEAWYMSSCIWRDCLKDLRSDNFKSGGRISGCGCKEYKDGGLAYGNSHAKGGMPMTVKNTGQNIEIEGGEGVVNKRSMQMTKQVEFQGKKMTPCEVISSINEMGGGVKFKCNDVKKIIDRDGEYD